MGAAADEEDGAMYKPGSRNHDVPIEHNINCNDFVLKICFGVVYSRRRGGEKGHGDKQEVRDAN